MPMPLTHHILRLLGLILTNPEVLEKITRDEALCGHLPDMDGDEDYDAISAIITEELDLLLLTTPEELSDAEYELRIHQETEGSNGPYPPFKTGSEVREFLESKGFSPASSRYVGWKFDKNSAMKDAVVRAFEELERDLEDGDGTPP